MKKTILSTVFGILLSTNVIAAPFLMSQPYAASAVQPDSFTVVIDGVSKSVAAVKDANNLNVLKFDLASITLGNKTATITATNVWGNSTAATFNFSANTPAVPTGFYISSN